MEFTVYLGEGLFNSGMLGFKRVLDDNDLPYEIVNYNSEQDKANGTGLRFDSKIFESFTDAYLKTLIEQAGKDAPFHTLKKKLIELKQLDLSSKDANITLEKIKKEVCSLSTKGRYLSAYEILKNSGVTFDFGSLIKIINNSKNQNEIIELITELIDEMNKHSDLFIQKDIFYGIGSIKVGKDIKSSFQCFWNGIAFVHPTNNKKEIKKAFEDSFIKPINKYIETLQSKKKRKTTLTCCNCNAEIIVGESHNMAWINNVGVDYAKKKSAYWNLNPDIVVCPICMLILI